MNISHESHLYNRCYNRLIVSLVAVFPPAIFFGSYLPFTRRKKATVMFPCDVFVVFSLLVGGGEWRLCDTAMAAKRETIYCFNQLQPTNKFSNLWVMIFYQP